MGASINLPLFELPALQLENLHCYRVLSFSGRILVNFGQATECSLCATAVGTKQPRAFS